jgi:hypothetical protein
MKTELEALLSEAKKLPAPTPAMAAAIQTAEQRLAEERNFDELKGLSKALQGVNPNARITIAESADRGNLYGLTVLTREPGLARKMARWFGCPENELPDEDMAEFDACDSWHGRGKLNLRTLADQLTKIEGELFECEMTVQEIHNLAAA